MRIDRMTLAYARRALREARHHLYDPNVTLIDFGHGQVGGRCVEEKLAIRLHVRRKHSPPALEAAVEAGRTRDVPRMIGGTSASTVSGGRTQPATGATRCC